MNNSNIVKDFPRVSADIVTKAAQYQPAVFADVAERRGAMHGRIQALRPRMKLAGPAFTVEVRPGDNLMIHAAMSLAKPGDVLVIDGKGDQNAALMGTIMMTACKQLGLAGVVIDGAVRDSWKSTRWITPSFRWAPTPTALPSRWVGASGIPFHAVGCLCMRVISSSLTAMAW